MKMMLRAAGAAFLVLVLTHCASKQEPLAFVAIGYNVEAGYKPAAQLETVAELIESAPKADLYLLSELSLSWAQPLAQGMGDYAVVTSNGAIETTDSLGLFFNPNRFELEQQTELPFGVHRYERPALIVQLKEKQTGRSLIVVGNHLMRGEAPLRQQQARLLSEWAAKQRLPVVALGDYNFDYDVVQGQGNPAFDLFMSSGQWQWVKPETLVKTNCDARYNSVLDFIFIHGNYQSAEAKILYPEPEYCSDETRRPDHRPVMARLVL